MLPTKCFMREKVFIRVVDFTLTSTTRLDQFLLAYLRHPSLGSTLYGGNPVELSLMAMMRWVSILPIMVLMEPECSEFCGVKSQRECSTTFRVINRTEDAQLYLDVYRKYSRVSGKVPCSSAFVDGVGDGLEKRKLQPSGNSDIFEAYLALCSSGAGSRRSRSLSQITPVFNSNLVHTDFSSVCGPSASLLGRSFHVNPNAVMITVDSQHSYHVSRDGENTQENCQLRSTIGVSNNGSSASRRDRNVQVRPHLNSAVGVRSTSRRTSHRVLTSGSTVDSNSVASAGTSYTYSDLGDYDRRCGYCGASFWYVERLKGHSHNQTPEYHL
ncbi:hypothetical protein Tco_1507643 [Tanacetum coccineum]